MPDRSDPLPVLDPAPAGDDPGMPLLTTGDMARETGSTLRTVRFYEEAGLLRPASRNDGGHRMFASDQLQKLRLILDLREAGLSLNDIRKLFELKSQCASPEEASRRLSELLGSQIDEMQRKIATLRRLREELASTVSVLTECMTCEDASFPSRCPKCEVLDRPQLPRAVRLLWDV